MPLTQEKPDAPAAPRHLKVADCAEALNATEEFVRQAIRGGRLAAIDISRQPGKSRAAYRVAAEDLAAFIAGRAVSAPDVRPVPRRRRTATKEYV